MKDFKVEINEHGFKGEATIKIKKFVERTAILKKFSNADKDQMEMAGKMFKLAQENIVSLNIKHESGKQISDVEELSYYAEGILVISSLAKIIMNGIQLKKISKQD